MKTNRTYSEQTNNKVVVSNQPVNVVYKTDEYSMFQLSRFNRNVILRESMIEEARLGLITPIIVNENMVVIDGQHRLKAAEKVGVPIEYIIKEGLGKDEIVRMNTIQKPWSLANFVEAYANQGKEEYVKLLNIIKDVYKNTTVVAHVAYHSSSIRPARKAIESGNFEFYNYEKAVEFFGYLNEFKKKALGGATVKTKNAEALYEIFQIPHINKDRLIEKVVETGLDEELKIKTLNKTDVLSSLLSAYNKNISPNSKFYVDYHITSQGQIKINEEKANWATVGR